MGSAISAVRENITAGDKANKEEIKDQLDFLVTAADNKLDHFQSELEAGFSNPDSISKKQVPGLRALRFQRGYRVGVSKEANEGIKDVVDTFFKIGENEKGMAAGLVEGFRKTVQTGLEAVLGNVQAGEQQEEKFFVFMQHNAIIRIDVKIWKYNFSGKGVMAESENVFAYVFCLSVVDHKILTKDELLYLLSEYAGDDKVMAYIEALVGLWVKLTAVDDVPRGGPYRTNTKVIPKATTPPQISSSNEKVDAVDALPVSTEVN
ncbi:hypothetical protein FRB98_001236 [Tulasnella sp. 332]|nr:hypothetical protein FRB98_001236 [Tulasnella sp. 332]